MKNIKSGKNSKYNVPLPSKTEMCLFGFFCFLFEFPTLGSYLSEIQKLKYDFFFPDNIYLLTRMIPDKIDRHLETYKYHLGLFRRSMAVFGPLT